MAIVMRQAPRNGGEVHRSGCTLRHQPTCAATACAKPRPHPVDKTGVRPRRLLCQCDARNMTARGASNHWTLPVIAYPGFHKPAACSWVAAAPRAGLVVRAMLRAVLICSCVFAETDCIGTVHPHADGVRAQSAIHQRRVAAGASRDQPQATAPAWLGTEAPWMDVNQPAGIDPQAYGWPLHSRR